MMAVSDLVFIAVALVVTIIFSVQAGRAEQVFWCRCRRNSECLRLQRQDRPGQSALQMPSLPLLHVSDVMITRAPVSSEFKGALLYQAHLKSAKWAESAMPIASL